MLADGLNGACERARRLQVTDSDFALHPRLEADSVYLCRWTLCQVRLINDARYPWLMLVPEQPNITEPFELTAGDQAQLWRESMVLAAWMKGYFRADKMNVAALGNVVPQLHVHHVARVVNDSAWPGPVWGVGEAEPYEPERLTALCQTLTPLLRTLAV